MTCHHVMLSFKDLLKTFLVGFSNIEIIIISFPCLRQASFIYSFMFWHLSCSTAITFKSSYITYCTYNLSKQISAYE